MNLALPLNLVCMEIPNYELFTSLRYDPTLRNASFNTAASGVASPYLLLPFHADRLRNTAVDFGWPKAAAVVNVPDVVERLRTLCDEAVEKYEGVDKINGLRLRILLSFEGQLRCEAFPAREQKQDPFDALLFNPELPSVPPPHVLAVYVDTEPTPSSRFTSYKTTSRAHYDAARGRRGLQDRNEPKEVVLWNERGEVTEASFRNVAFWRDGSWVTPKASSGALPGTVQRWMLESGKIREGTILKDDIQVGEWVLMSNGWDVTVLGKVEKGPKDI